MNGTYIAIAQPVELPVAVATHAGALPEKYGAVAPPNSASGISAETVAAYLALPAVQTAILDWTPNEQAPLVIAKILAWKVLLPFSPDQRQRQVEAWFPNSYHASLTGIRQLADSMNAVAGPQPTELPPFSVFFSAPTLKLSVLLQTAQRWEESGRSVAALLQAVQDLVAGKPAAFVTPWQQRWCLCCC